MLGSDGQRTSRDRRFADPAWRTNPLLRRIALGYLASCQAVERIVADAEVDGAPRARQAIGRQSVGCCGADQQPGPASVVVAARDRHGRAELVRGLQQLVIDMAAPPRLPATVDTTAFSIGENIAATPGKVVLRSELFE